MEAVARGAAGAGRELMEGGPGIVAVETPEQAVSAAFEAIARE